MNKALNSPTYTINSVSVIHRFPVRTARIFSESAICNDFDITEKITHGTQKIQQVLQQQHY